MRVKAKSIIVWTVLAAIIFTLGYMFVTAPDKIEKSAQTNEKSESQKDAKKKSSFGKDVLKWMVIESIISDELP